MTDQPIAKTKRAAKRYSYTYPGHCDIGGILLGIQLQNISTSGVQFSSNTKIEIKRPIKIIWDDTKFGKFNITFLIAREIPKPENAKSLYYYGCQYYDLTIEDKNKLLELLRYCKSESKNEIKKEVEKTNLEYLFGAIEQGESFFQQTLTSGANPLGFNNLIQEIKGYEKDAFTKKDEVSLFIKRLTMHNFHCNLLGMLTAAIVQNRALQPKFFHHILIQLSEITALENEMKLISKKLLEQPTADKESISHITESSNRLFYTKQNLLQSVLETIDPETVEFKEAFEKVREDHIRSLEITNMAFRDGEAEINIRRSKKPEEYSKAEAIVDVPVMTETKPGYFSRLVKKIFK